MKKLRIERRLVVTGVILLCVYIGLLAYATSRTRLPWYDEAHWVSRSVGWMQDNRLDLSIYPECSPQHTGINNLFTVPYFIVFGTIYKVTGFSHYTHRLISLAFLALTIAFGWRLTRRLSGHRLVATAVTIVFALSPWFRGAALNGRPEAFTGFIWIVSTLALLNLFEGSSRRPLAVAGTAFLVTVLGEVQVYCFPFAAVYWVSMFVLIIGDWQTAVKPWHSVIGLLVGTLVGVGLIIVPFGTSFPQVLANTLGTGGHFSESTRTAQDMLMSAGKVLVLFIRNPLVVLGAVGLLLMARRNRFALVVTLGTLAHVCFLVFVVPLFYYQYKWYYVSLAAVFIGAVAIAKAVRSFPNRWVKIAAAVGFCIPLTFWGLDSAKSIYGATNEMHSAVRSQVAEQVKNMVPSGTVVALPFTLYFDFVGRSAHVYSFAYRTGGPRIPDGDYLCCLARKGVEYFVVPHGHLERNPTQACNLSLDLLGTVGRDRVVHPPIYHDKKLWFDVYRNGTSNGFENSPASMPSQAK